MARDARPRWEVALRLLASPLIFTVGIWWCGWKSEGSYLLRDIPIAIKYVLTGRIPK